MEENKFLVFVRHMTNRNYPNKYYSFKRIMYRVVSVAISKTILIFQTTYSIMLL